MDEIDKMGTDWRGDPAAALLEVLDPEQNFEFNDHFLDVPFDISKVMFIATANTLWGIPVSLRDRMEIIDFSGYTHDEKIEIAKKFLIPRQLREHGLKVSSLKIDDKGIDGMIRGYTREAGVRNLNREFASMCRRAARRIVEEKLDTVKVTPENLGDYLGIPRFLHTSSSYNAVGIATGLAWTENGGEVLAVEAVAVPGKGALTLTGKLGDVMKESAQAAFSYIRSVELAPDSYVNSHNFHVHIPEGAIPKDGPSAGVTMATALASLFSGRPVKQNLSMTGELTLTGRVLAIGGLKEKVIASFRDDINTVLFPKANLKELEEIPQEIRSKMRLHPVERMDEVLKLALEPVPAKGRRGKVKTGR
jgi:ATP-dependent Lon protease